MNPGAILLAVHRSGGELKARGGKVQASPPGRLSLNLRAGIRAAKAELLLLLETPPRAARGAWTAALGEVADRWDVAAAAARELGQEPPWFEDEGRMGPVREALLAVHDAAGLAHALEAIEHWRSSWLAILGDVPPVQGGP